MSAIQRIMVMPREDGETPPKGPRTKKGMKGKKRAIARYTYGLLEQYARNSDDMEDARTTGERLAVNETLAENGNRILALRDILLLGYNMNIREMLQEYAKEEIEQTDKEELTDMLKNLDVDDDAANKHVLEMVREGVLPKIKMVDEGKEESGRNDERIIDDMY